MTGRNFTGAHIVDLAQVRAGRAGDVVARRSDGHRLGNHGNRAPMTMRTKTISDLRDIAAYRGRVTAADKEFAARAAGVSLRSVNRWWSDERERQVQAANEHAQRIHDNNTAGGDGNDAGTQDAAPVNLPKWLYRHAEPGKLQLTPAEIAFFGQHNSIKAAIDAVRANPTHRLNNYGTSTIYAAHGNVAAPIRTSAKKGAKAGRQIEATYPLTGRDAVNESWSIDEYDTKVVANYHGQQVAPKMLLVRERASGLPLAYVVLPRAATGADTGVVLAAAAIGYTVTHPGDPTTTLHVGGVARHLVSDQGGPFLGEEGVAHARRLGIGLTPVPSHQPQANGDHEVMHQSLLRHLVDGPGSRRGWTDRAGNRSDHGVIPFETVLDEVEAWFVAQVNAAYTSGPRRGRTRIQVYADHVDAGTTYPGHELSAADEGAVAYHRGVRTYDPTRGIAYDSRYWLSPELASTANPGQKIEIRQLLSTDVLYAYDTHGRFIGLLRPRDEADLADITQVHADRARRERFVKDHIADPKAKAAQADAVAAQDEVAERLADAAQQAGQVANPNTEPIAAAAGAEHSTFSPRGRAPGTPDTGDVDATAEALADRFSRARGNAPERSATAPTHPDGGGPGAA